MPHMALQHIVAELRAATLPAHGLSDAQLLHVYATQRDELAFECLVWRYASVVWGVCRRGLPAEADAEDAFQATFLVLFRKGATLPTSVVLGAWLHGVARNVVRQARRALQRRQAHEAAYVPRNASTNPDLVDAVDTEIQRLPTKYRLPVILCEMEGRPLAPTAAELGWKLGTLASRLARGKALLAKRLRQRGLASVLLPPVAVGATLVSNTLHACCRSATVSVERYAQGVIRTMHYAKLKFLLPMLGLLTLVLGTDWALSQQSVSPPMEPRKTPTVEIGPPPREVPDTELVRGRWRVDPQLSRTLKSVPAYTMFEFIQQEHAGLLIAATADLKTVHWYTWSMDAAKKHIDFTARVKGVAVPSRGLYKWDNTRLHVQLSVPLTFNGDSGEHQRPSSFDQTGTSPLLVLEREQMAWSEPKDQIQFGVCVEPHTTQAVVVGQSLKLHLYVRNTSNNAVPIDIPCNDGNPSGWTGYVTDVNGHRYIIPGMPSIPGVPVPPTRLKQILGSHEVALIGETWLHLKHLKSPPTGIWPQGVVHIPVGRFQVQYFGGWAQNLRTGQLTLHLQAKS